MENKSERMNENKTKSQKTNSSGGGSQIIYALTKVQSAIRNIIVWWCCCYLLVEHTLRGIESILSESRLYVCVCVCGSMRSECDWIFCKRIYGVVCMWNGQIVRIHRLPLINMLRLALTLARALTAAHHLACLSCDVALRFVVNTHTYAARMCTNAAGKSTCIHTPSERDMHIVRRSRRESRKPAAINKM